MVVIILSPKAMSIGGGDPADWIDWMGPDRPTLACFNDSGDEWGSSYIGAPSPWNGEHGVPITANGVLTCINVTVESGCYANITFEWLNYQMVFDDWLEWAHAQNWWDWDSIDWASEPSTLNDSYWFEYYSEDLISYTQDICHNNTNVTCRTENDWVSEFQDWRVIANFTCPQTKRQYNTTCYYYYETEDCPISYIYPASPNGTGICPCCDAMCFNITNEEGHPMNITIFRNDSINTTYYVVNKYFYVENDSYCFCIDGHIDDIYYPMRYNETYHWFVNITDTETEEGYNSSIFQFRTAEDPVLCPCGYSEITDLIEDTDTFRDDAWLIGVIMVFSSLGIIAFINQKRRR